MLSVSTCCRSCGWRPTLFNVGFLCCACASLHGGGAAFGGVGLSTGCGGGVTTCVGAWKLCTNGSRLMPDSTTGSGAKAETGTWSRQPGSQPQSLLPQASEPHWSLPQWSEPQPPEFVAFFFGLAHSISRRLYALPCLLQTSGKTLPFITLGGCMVINLEVMIWDNLHLLWIPFEFQANSSFQVGIYLEFQGNSNLHLWMYFEFNLNSKQIQTSKFEFTWNFK